MATAIPPLRFEPAGLFVRGTGVSPELLELVHPQLEAARTALLRGEASVGSSPADIDLVELPDRIIADYRAHRQRSQLGRVLATARRLAEAVDRVVVVAGPGTLPAVRALVDACRHPYHNELSRAERGGQPRLYFAGDSLDNDLLAGLLDVLTADRQLGAPQGTWGLIVIGDFHETKAECAARGVLLRALDKATCGDPQSLGRLCVSISPARTLVDRFAGDLGCDRFEIAGGAGGRQSVFDAAGLLPAAVLGIDVRRLLEGAARLNAQFRDLPPAENVVLRYIGACHLLQDQGRPWTPALVPWTDSLQSFARWHNQRPMSANDPSDAHTANRSMSAHNSRTFPVNLLVDAACRDNIVVGLEGDRVASETLPGVLAANALQARERATDSCQPWAELHLPQVDAPTIGQLFQLFLLAPLLLQRLPRVTQPAASLASRSSLAPSP